MRALALPVKRPEFSLTLACASFLALALLSNHAAAWGCGMMKTPEYWGMPMHGPQHRGMPKTKAFPPGYGASNRGGGSVVDVARVGGEFTTLLTALEEAGLIGLLQGKGPYTLLAPTDSAFKQLPNGALQELLADKDKLVALLKYHIVPGGVTAVDILQSRELKTATGQPLPTVNLGITRADIPARNGILHVIDKVLLPAG